MANRNTAQLDSKKDDEAESNPNTPKLIPYSEVQKHTTRDSLWVIIDGQVYDATCIVDTHPGGTAVLLKNSGKDATSVVSFILAIWLN